jgi:hypothetical protein
MLRTRTTRTGILLCALVALLALGPASLAQEVGDPRDTVGELTDSVKQAAGGGGGGSNTTPRAPSQTTPAAAPSAPTQDDDSGAHETADPAPPDHAGGSVVDLDVAGEDAVDVGSTNAEVEEDGKSSGDVTVLAIGGNEIVGAHSNSRQGPENDSVAPFDALCEGTDGGVCVGLLFADTSSTENGQSSSARSQASLAFACLGGSQASGREECDGEVSLDVASSDSRTTQDNQTGATTAEQETELADACLGGEVGDTCSGVGAEAMSAESSSSAPSESGPGSSSRSSCVVTIQAQGSGDCVLEDPQELEVPPGCEAAAAIVCLYVNQGETFIFTGGGASRQETAHVRVLPGLVEGSDLVSLHLATAETLATNTGAVLGAPGGPPDEGVLGGGGGPEGGGGAGPGGPPELAFTGFELVKLLTVLLLLAVAGLAMLALDRRRAVPA